MEAVFLFLYPMVTIVSLVAYLPQIRMLLLAKTNCADFSLSSWLMWVWTTSISLGYVMTNAFDLLLAITTGVNLLCCILVAVLILYKRVKYAKAVAPASVPVAAE